jgi:biopolymer transport protein ExbB
MIKTFGILSLSGIGHPTAVTGGVAEALIATALGLAIAIFSLFFYNFYLAKVETVRAELETQTYRLLAWLKETG